MASGKFIGDVVAIWLADDPKDPGGDDRMMVLTQQFAFTDPRGKTWTAPVGTRTDGASIPQIAWVWISPFIGDYRRAAVIHDRYCTPEHRTETWKDTHRVLYDAMLADGTGKIKAGIIYAAVYAFGPRWPNPVTNKMQLSAPEQARLLNTLEGAPSDSEAVWTQISDRDFARILRRVENGELGVEEIELAIDTAPVARVVAEVPPMPQGAEIAFAKSAKLLSAKSVKVKPAAPKAAKDATPAKLVKADSKKQRNKSGKKKGGKKKR